MNYTYRRGILSKLKRMPLHEEAQIRLEEIVHDTTHTLNVEVEQVISNIKHMLNQLMSSNETFVLRIHDLMSEIIAKLKEYTPPDEHIPAQYKEFSKYEYSNGSLVEYKWNDSINDYDYDNGVKLSSVSKCRKIIEDSEDVNEESLGSSHIFSYGQILGEYIDIIDKNDETNKEILLCHATIMHPVTGEVIPIIKLDEVLKDPRDIYWNLKFWSKEQLISFLSDYDVEMK